MEFSVRLKELRVEKGLTQRDIAYEVGLTPNSICEWEKGRSEPSSDALKKLAKIFECSIDFLLGISDDFGNVIVYQQTDGVSSLSVDEQKIIDAIRKNAPIYPVDWITMYAELPRYMQESIFAELKGMHLGYKVSKNGKAAKNQ